MPTIKVTNISDEPQRLGDLYTTVEVGKFIETYRASTDIPRMRGLHKLIAEGKVVMTETPTADERACGMG